MKKIFLLADDDIDDRSLFKEALQQIDPSIICYCVANGKQVFNLLNDQAMGTPNIIFLDINMPGMNGWQCVTALKSHEAYKHIPVLIYSTSAHHKEANMALELGALCFFIKPIDFIEFRNILRLISANLAGNLLEAFSKFNTSKSKKIFVF